jgi:hypothetical protein
MLRAAAILNHTAPLTTEACVVYMIQISVTIPHTAVLDQIRAKRMKIHVVPIHVMGQDSSVCIATRYGMDGPGIEFQWGRNFPHLSRPLLEPSQPHIQWVPGLSRG